MPIYFLSLTRWRFCVETGVQLHPVFGFAPPDGQPKRPQGIWSTALPVLEIYFIFAHVAMVTKIWDSMSKNEITVRSTAKGLDRHRVRQNIV